MGKEETKKHVAVSDSTAKCLLCDVPVLVNAAEWAKLEMPIALCESCEATAPPWPSIRIIYLMRCQISSLSKKVESLEGKSLSLAKSVEELNTALLAE